MGSPQEDINKAAIHETYQSNLVRMGLLKPEFKSQKKDELPEFDNKTGMLKVSYYRITHLGTLLLRYLDLLDEGRD